MAKPIVSRRRALRLKARKSKARSKPEVIEVEGHILTPEVHQRYVEAFQEQEVLNKDAPFPRRLQLALANALSPERPTHRAEKQLRDIASRALSFNNLLGSAAAWPFYSTHGIARSAGCRLLDEMATEAQVFANLLTEMARGIRKESETKLQDWLEHEHLLHRISSSKPEVLGSALAKEGRS
jgi:hypothetical protein